MEGEKLPLDVRTDVILTEVFPSPRQSLKSLPFFVVVMYYCLGLLRFNFYLAELSVVADFHFKNQETTARLGTISTFVLAGGIPTAFLCGAVVDKLRSKCAPNIEELLKLESSNEKNRAIMWYNTRPAASSMFIFAVLTLIVSSLVFVPIEAVYYVNFVFFLLMRGFLFTTFSITVFSAFPVAQFGTIFGLCTTIAGVFSCAQFALLLLSPTQADICALVLTILLFIPPSIVFIMSSITLKRIPRDEEILQ